MPPVRSNQPQSTDPSSSSHKTNNDQKRKHHGKHYKDKESSNTPGISKIKASLRQTRRFLAKDKLAADVRIETERRLKALEKELEQAELVKKEKTFATRYHKIKFFERQKVTRKINQTKKQLASETENSKAKVKLTKALYELRVDLNYILHYPKLKKYISLFPPEVRNGEEPPSADDAAKTAEGREEVRSWVQTCMERNELSNEPELERSEVEKKQKPKHKEWQSGGKEESKKAKQVVEESDDDDFFGEDDDST